MENDYIIVGSGLTGSVIARMLTDAGCKVTVIEKRPYMGGNLHDQISNTGIPYHTYGPHFFRTDSSEIRDFLKRFSIWYPFEAVIKTFVDGRLENWPISLKYIQREIGSTWDSCFKGHPTNFEEQSLSMMPRLVYEKFVKPYTEKQWGVSADTLETALASRFEVRLDNDPRLSKKRYQGLPEQGYTELIKNVLNGIEVHLNCDYLKHRPQINAKKLLVFTGAVDAYFDYRFGRLRYRGQKRTVRYLRDTEIHQPYPIVNYPSSDREFIRVIEWKHFLPTHQAQRCKGTLLSYETPFTPEDPDLFEYPFPGSIDRAIYDRYRQLAYTIPGLLICGRLGEYRYYDMDHSIEKAMVHAKNIISNSSF